MKKSNDAPGMKGERSRNQNGELRDKRDDTYMGTIEKKYNKDFNVRSDMHLGTYLKENNIGKTKEVLQNIISEKNNPFSNKASILLNDLNNVWRNVIN